MPAPSAQDNKAFRLSFQDGGSRHTIVEAVEAAAAPDTQAIGRAAIGDQDKTFSGAAAPARQRLGNRYALTLANPAAHQTPRSAR